MRMHSAIAVGFVAAALSGCDVGPRPASTGIGEPLVLDPIEPVDSAAVATWGETDTDVIGEAADSDIIDYLRLIGDTAAADAFSAASPAPWQHTDHAYGFIAIDARADTIAIAHAGAITPDLKLRDSQIRVTLDRLRVFDYPGSSEHKILIEFYGQNQVQNQTEHVRFSQYYRAREGGGAGVIGYPVFLGLNVGRNGAAFRVLTVNVENSNTQNFLNFLDSDIFKQGLKFAAGLNPAVPMLSGFVVGVTKMVASSKHNRQVQSADIGLDFSAGATGARLAEGSYVVVQVPRMSDIEWNNWVYLPRQGLIRSRQPPHDDIPYNYLIFRVTRYVGG